MHILFFEQQFILFYYFGPRRTLLRNVVLYTVRIISNFFLGVKMDSETLQESIHINFILLYNKGHNLEFEEVRQIVQSQALKILL